MRLTLVEIKCMNMRIVDKLALLILEIHKNAEKNLNKFMIVIKRRNYNFLVFKLL